MSDSSCMTDESRKAKKMLQVWQMLRTAKWLITGTEKAQDKATGCALA